MFSSRLFRHKLHQLVYNLYCSHNEILVLSLYVQTHPDDLRRNDGSPPPHPRCGQHSSDYRGDSTQRRRGRPGGRLQGSPEPIGYVAGSPATEGTINNNNNNIYRYLVGCSDIYCVWDYEESNNRATRLSIGTIPSILFGISQ